MNKCLFCGAQTNKPFCDDCISKYGKTKPVTVNLEPTPLNEQNFDFYDWREISGWLAKKE